jgi:hypothetical protein
MVILGIVFLTVITISCLQEPRTSEEVETIEHLKGPEWSRYVGKTVTVEGIFVRDPLPMLVIDLDIVIVNMPMPKDQYIILVGKEAEEIDPKEYGGQRLRITGIVTPLEYFENYRGENVGIEVISYEIIERLKRYFPFLEPFKILPPKELRLLPNHYAILFSGGYNQVNNHIRYWNDLKFMYSTLVKKYGYKNKNIVVLYADGKGLDGQIQVHYSATQTNLEKVFNLLKEKLTKGDFVFIFTTNHGGGFHKAGCQIFGGQIDVNGDEPAADIILEKDCNLDLNGDGDKTDQVSWDEVLYSWGGSIFDDSFHTLLANLEYERMVIVMEQCFSGGLIADMTQGGSNRIIMSAAGEYEFSWAMPPSYNYDEFSYHFTCAINGADPKGIIVNADKNGDGKISMVEAFNYARSKDTQPETPWYEDSGDGIPHSGNMPAYGEGALGGKTFLK